MSDQDKEHEERMRVVDATIIEIINMRKRVSDLIMRYELLPHLSVREASFLNEVAIAGQQYLDTPEEKSDGNLEQ